MKTCGSCGFDNVEEGKSCPLCGQVSKIGAGLPSGQDETPTASLPEGWKAALTPGGGRNGNYPQGHLYGQRFRIDGLLGRGGMGTVYRVHDLVEKRNLALKILHASVQEEDDGAERFKREIEILSTLHHPAVPRVFGWGANADEHFFVAELVVGRDLKSVILDRGAWLAADAAALGATIADALASAHEAGIVHRDVKPDNIMLADDGSVKLLDFGVARGVGLDMKTITKTGMIVGTPQYMSPEQLDSHRVDERSDVYSLGVVLFELATARLPFDGDTPLSVAMKHLTTPPPPIRSVKSDVPAWFEKIVSRCLEKAPAKRYLTARELAVDLRRPRITSAPSARRLSSGDSVVEDSTGASDWVLVLQAPREKLGWAPGMALLFSGSYYKLRETVPPSSPGKSWTYRFSSWPEEEVFRRIVDYEADARASAARDEPLASKLRKWIPGGKG